MRSGRGAALLLLLAALAPERGSPAGFTAYTRQKEAVAPAPERDWEEEALEESIPPVLDARMSVRASAEQDERGRRQELLMLGGQGTVLRTPVSWNGVLQKHPERAWTLQDGALSVDGARRRLRVGYQYANLWGFASQSQRLRVVELGLKSTEAPWWSDLARQSGAPVELRLPGAVSAFSEKTAWQTNVIAGSQPTFSASTAAARELEQTVTGAQSVFLAKFINLRAAGYRFANQAPSEPLPGLISGHSLYMAGASVRLPATTLALDYGLSRARPEGLRETQDQQWRGQMTLELRALTVVATRQRVGRRFRSFGDPAAYQDYEGTEVAPVLRLSKAFQMRGGWLTSRDNVDRDSAVATRRDTVVRAGADLSLQAWRTRLDWQDESRIGGPRKRQWRAGAAWSPGRTRVDIDASHQATSLQGGVSSVAQSARLGLFHSFAAGGYAGLSEQVRRNALSSPVGFETLTLNHGLSLSWFNFDEFLNCVVDADVETAKEGRGAPARHRASGSVALNFQLNLDQTVRLSARVKSYDLDKKRAAGWTAGTEWSVTFRLRALRKAGRLAGVVYLDLNENGRRDHGEPPAPGVPLVLGDGREVRSSRSGTFELRRVAPGTASIGVLEDELPDAYAPAGALFNAEVSEFGVSRVEIPVYRSR